MKRCTNCGAAVKEWIRPEPQNPENIAAIKAIELKGTAIGCCPPHVCPNCKHYWWCNEDLIEDEPWPDDW
jgi:hypothetical protein